MNTDAIETLIAPCATATAVPCDEPAWTSIDGYLAELGVSAFPRPSSVAGFVAVFTSPWFSEAN